MNKDVAQFVDQLNGVSDELRQRVIESETLILSKDEIYGFSKLFASSATVITAADEAFVQQKQISNLFIGLATVSLSLLIPLVCMVIPLFPFGLQHKQSNVAVSEQTTDDKLLFVPSSPELQLKTVETIPIKRVQCTKQGLERDRN